MFEISYVTIVSTLCNMLLFFSFLYFWKTQPCITVNRDWKEPSTDYLQSAANKYFLSAKRNTPYYNDCRVIFDDLFDITKKYEKNKFGILYDSGKNGIEITSYYFISYFVLIVFWVKSEPLELFWWQILIVVIFNILVNVIIAFILHKFTHWFQENNSTYLKYSFFEYDEDIQNLEPLIREDFTDFKSYLEAEYDRSYYKLNHRLTARKKLDNYYDSFLHKKNAQIYCLLSMCVYFIFLELFNMRLL